MKPAVFLDRDGTINVEREYLHKVEDFAFIDGAPQAIRRLREAGFLVIVVTNQSGVARGFFGLREVATLHRHLQRELARFGTQVDAFYICPHHPKEGVGEFSGECDCRKGKPGLLLQAAREHDIDLVRSYMVGDKIADVEAGRAAGCQALLVLTGHGTTEVENLAAGTAEIVADLTAAVDWIFTKK